MPGTHSADGFRCTTFKEERAGFAQVANTNLTRTFLASPADNLLAGVFKCFWRSKAFAMLWGVERNNAEVTISLC